MKPKIPFNAGGKQTGSDAHSRQRYWAIIAILFIVATLLFVLSAVMKFPAQIQGVDLAVADALVVAVVVSLAVEPLLLKYFSEKLALQTFWSSFYSRAPSSYIQAIQELASVRQFCTASQWHLTFDWVGDQKEVIRLTVQWTIHRQNQSSKPYGLQPGIFMYESALPGFTTTIDSYRMSSSDPGFECDLLNYGHSRQEHTPDGRLIVIPARDRQPAFFTVQPGKLYTTTVKVTTYVTPSGYLPLTVTAPTLQCTIQLDGTAVSDLYLSVLHPGQGAADLTAAEGLGGKKARHSEIVIEGRGCELSKRERIQVGQVFITGQAILLLWSPDRSTDAVAGSRSAHKARQ